jgi:prepilin-type N-terminal cleavage/methylation domain-containing protein
MSGITHKVEDTRGFTLVELLIVIGCICLLAAILFPVFSRAKYRALETTEISEMRQLGVAQGIYAADTGEQFCSVDQLLQSGLIPKPICLSPLDRMPNGLANDYMSFLAKHSNLYASLLLPYPETFVGFRELGYSRQSFTDNVLTQPGAGWLVSLTRTTGATPKIWDSMLTGYYRRLEMDGSVQLKPQVTFPYMGSTAQHPIFWFMDVSDEWKIDFANHEH